MTTEMDKRFEAIEAMKKMITRINEKGVNEFFGTEMEIENDDYCYWSFRHTEKIEGHNNHTMNYKVHFSAITCSMTIKFHVRNEKYKRNNLRYPVIIEFGQVIENPSENLDRVLLDTIFNLVEMIEAIKVLLNSDLNKFLTYKYRAVLYNMVRSVCG